MDFLEWIPREISGQILCCSSCHVADFLWENPQDRSFTGWFRLIITFETISLFLYVLESFPDKEDGLPHYTPPVHWRYPERCSFQRAGHFEIRFIHDLYYKCFGKWYEYLRNIFAFMCNILSILLLWTSFTENCANIFIIRCIFDGHGLFL